MLTTLSALSSQSIFNLVVFGIIIVVLIAIAVVFSLWKKGKVRAKSNFFFKMDGALKQITPMVKAKYLKNSNVPEACFLWIVALLGLTDAVLSLVTVISLKAFSLDFLLSLFFVILLVLLSALDYKLSASYPYYYDYNPSLLMYSIISLVLAFLNFVGKMSNGILLYFLFGVIGFVGNVLLYGFIVLARFFKREFKPLDLIVYLGALLTVVYYSLIFGFYQITSDAYFLAANVISLAYSIGIVTIVLYVYDGFAFVKRLFKR